MTSKYFFIDFKPSQSNNEDTDDYFISINDTVIKHVSETKFLGVTLDWSPHIKKLSKKISCSAGVLNTIKDNIPEELFKNLYFTLFESHLSYDITLWGGISNN